MNTAHTTKLIGATFATVAVFAVAAATIPNAGIIAAGLLVGAGLVAMGALEAKKRAY